MSNNNSKGLGRGLDALFNYSQPQNELASQPEGGTAPFINISLENIEKNPNQPREKFNDESLAELAASIREQGLLQPILVRSVQPVGKYQIVAGERRWRAARLAGLASVPVIVKELDDVQTLVLALIENIQRDDLNPMELARALAKLKETLGISDEELGDKVGMARGSVSNMLRLLNLEAAAQEDVMLGRLGLGHARCLLSISDPIQSEELRLHIIDNQLNVRETENAVNFWHNEGRFPWHKETVAAKSAPETKTPEIKHLAKEIGIAFNCRSRISGNTEKGKITLAYESSEQFYELLDKLGISLDLVINPQESEK